MSSIEETTPVEELLVTEREEWLDGPPHELFKRLRGECPVHFTSRISEYPEEDGYWSVTTAEGVHAVSRDWQTYSSELGGITALTQRRHPARAAAGHVHRDGPAQARPAQGALPARASPRGGSPTTTTRSARSPIDVLDRLEGRDDVRPRRRTSPSPSSPA